MGGVAGRPNSSPGVSMVRRRGRRLCHAAGEPNFSSSSAARLHELHSDDHSHLVLRSIQCFIPILTGQAVKQTREDYFVVQDSEGGQRRLGFDGMWPPPSPFGLHGAILSRPDSWGTPPPAEQPERIGGGKSKVILRSALSTVIVHTPLISARACSTSNGTGLECAL